MFQIAFPFGSLWFGSSMALYFCTLCAEEKFLIPEMIDGSLAGANIPKDFLLKYQKNFSLVIFETEEAVLRDEYIEKVKFCELVIDPGSGVGNFGKIGGTPIWASENETPGSYADNIDLKFLIQIAAGQEFSVVHSAPPQIELGISGEPEPSPLDHYQLFLGNELYFLVHRRMKNYFM